MAKTIHTVTANTTQLRNGTLIDRGANGGIAGENICVMDTVPHRFIDVQGIDNHRVTNIPIVTCGGVINTQHGEVIAVMHQMAYTGKGKTILSSGQMETFQQNVCEKSRKVSGYQRIMTKDGYVIPINIRSRLPYVTMHPYTDGELDRLPQVHLTADLDWDPKSLDDEMEDDELWFIL